MFRMVATYIFSGALLNEFPFFGAFCQGLLGLNHFLPTAWVFRIKPLKVVNFEQGSRKQPRTLDGVMFRLIT